MFLLREVGVAGFEWAVVKFKNNLKPKFAESARLKRAPTGARTTLYASVLNAFNSPYFILAVSPRCHSHLCFRRILSEEKPRNCFSRSR